VGVVIWINGPFSAGKTTVAEILARDSHGHVLDPEILGVMLRDHIVPATLYPGDFQDLALWRAFTRDAVIDVAARHQGPVVIPMTVARPEYFTEIIEAIRARQPTHHFTLMASRDEILRREKSRPDDTGGWSAKTIDRLLPELADARYAEHIDTEHLGPQETAAVIRARCAF
jgi:chloramphenicol 3-O-phosphotransferase